MSFFFFSQDLIVISLQGKWETSGKKKKNRQAQQKAPEVNGHEPAPVEKEEKEPVENTNKKREPKQREGGYRYRGPPRMNRGNQGGRNCKLQVLYFFGIPYVYIQV